MKIGKWTFYTIQVRTVKQSKIWGEPDSPMVPFKEPYWSDWHFASFDNHKAFSPILPNTQHRDYKYKYPNAEKEIRDVRNKTETHGWWTLKYAKQALDRVRKCDEKGEYDHYENMGKRGKLQRRVRHEYRLVRVSIDYSVAKLIEPEPAKFEELAEASR